MSTPSDSLRVLIVEDDESNREVMQLVLESAGHHVSTAGTGAEALKRVAEEKPDAVLLDMLLPDQTGETLSATLRSRFEPAPRIIITSGMTLRSADAARLGADAVLQKPFGPDRLLAVLR
jgi:CheY-like chemotaxis protein